MRHADGWPAVRGPWHRRWRAPASGSGTTSRRQGAAAQSRAMSLAEATANVTVGYGLAVLAHILIFLRFGLHVSLGENLAIGAAFTIVSVFRSYALRRLFEAIRERGG